MTEEQFCGLPPKPGSWNRPMIVDGIDPLAANEALSPAAIYLLQISKDPTPEMIRDGNGYQYIPKSILQRELNRIYQGQIKWEMNREQVLKQGMFAVGTLHVRLPFNGEWICFSGTASLPHRSGMRLDFPALEAQCLKNACKKIGPWFGQCLNLEHEDAEPAVVDEAEVDIDAKTEAKMNRFKELIAAATTLNKLAEHKRDIDKEGMGKLLTKDYMNKVKELNSKP